LCGKKLNEKNITCAHPSESKEKRRKKIIKKNSLWEAYNMPLFTGVMEIEKRTDGTRQKNMNYLVNSLQEHYIDVHCG
jgi:hypothetical protein